MDPERFVVKEMVMHDPTQQFRQFLQQREAVASAYAAGDTGPLEKIATRQEPATYFGPGGGTDQGLPAVQEATAQGAKHFRPGGVSRLEILHAQASGELAYWVGLQHALVHSPDRPSPAEMTLRVTELFRREDGAWKLVHRHADMLAKPT
jgi:ketosteroid isomerase-like protein